MPEVKPVLEWLEKNERRSIERLMDWLKIPSISTDPRRKADVRRAAEWAAASLREAGLEVELRETGEPAGAGHPTITCPSCPVL